MSYYTIPYQAPASGVGQPPGGSTTPPYCGSISAMQQMLSDLGYYAGVVDGIYGVGTEGAMAEFKRVEGLESVFVTGEDCQRLIERWNARAGGGVAPVPLPGTGPAARLKRQMVRVARRPMVQDTRTQPPPNGAAVATVGPGALDKASRWWAAQSTPVKAGVIVGGVAVLGVGAYALAR